MTAALALITDTEDGTKALPYANESDPYRPTFDLSTDWDAMIPEPDGRTTLVGNKGVAETVPEMAAMAREYAPQMARVALFLSAPTVEQTCYNVWRWLKHYIRYVPDTPGVEQLRSPARLWKDRAGDCDCYAITAAAILLNLNLEPVYKVVGFRESGRYAHVYVQCDGWTIDPVMHLFNEEPPKISVSYPQPLYMNIERLTGLGELGCACQDKTNGLGCACQDKNLNGVAVTYDRIAAVPHVGYRDNPILPTRGLGGVIFGFGSVEPPTAATQKLQAKQVETLRRIGQGDKEAQKELRKIHAAIKWNGRPEQQAYLSIWDLVSDISPDGNFVFEDEDDQAAAAAKVAAVMEEAVSGYMINGMSLSGWANGPDEMGELLGELRAVLSDPEIRHWVAIGRLTKAERKARRKRIGRRFKKTMKKIGRGLKKAVQYLNMINPATAVMRGAFLGIVAANFLKLGEKMRLTILTDEEAKILNIPPDKLAKFRKTWPKVLEVFKMFGGVAPKSEKRLRGAIRKGSENKDFFKPLKKAKKKGLLKGLGEYDGLDGLGASDAPLTPEETVSLFGIGALGGILLPYQQSSYSVTNPWFAEKQGLEGTSSILLPYTEGNYSVTNPWFAEKALAAIFDDRDAYQGLGEPITIAATSGSAAAVIAALAPVIKKLAEDGAGKLIDKGIDKLTEGKGGGSSEPEQSEEDGEDNGEEVEGLGELAGEDVRMKILSNYHLLSPEARAELKEAFPDMPYALEGAFLELAGYMNPALDGITLGGKKGKAKRQAKKAARQTTRAKKKAGRKTKKANRKQEKALRKAQKEIAEQGGDTGESSFTPGAMELPSGPMSDGGGGPTGFQKFTQGAKKLLSTFMQPRSQGFQNEAQMQAAMPYINAPTPPSTSTDKNKYTPFIIGGVALVALIGGGYLLFKK